MIDKDLLIKRIRHDSDCWASTGEVYDLVKAVDNIVIWHPYPQEKPTENERYLLTCEYKCCIGVTYGKWWDDEFCDIDEEGKVIAWAERPKAYEP